jgi:hypothetical protein
MTRSPTVEEELTMSDNVDAASHDDYTQEARAAILAAVGEQHDFGGWLAGVLSRAAAELGSSDALIAGRPGSWEADLVRQLVKGTVGWDDDYLAEYKEPLP